MKIRKILTVSIVLSSFIVVSGCHPFHRKPGLPGKPYIKKPSVPLPGPGRRLPRLP